MKVTIAMFLITVAAYVLVDGSTLALWPPASINFKPWQIVTYGFAHVNLLHLVINLLALASFGPALERAWGSARLLVVYIACLVVAGLIQTAVSQQPVIGASGVLFGLFAAYVIAHPKRKVISLVIVPIPAWSVLVLYIGLSVLALAFHWLTGVAHAAHVGGALTGAACALWFRTSV